MTPITRAEFLKTMAVGGAGVALLAACGGKVIGTGSGDEDAARPARDAKAGASSASPTAGATILAVATGASPSANVEKAVAALGGMREFVRRGDVVVVKPNICTSRPPEYATTTDPAVVATLVSMALDAGAKKVLVMDNPISSDPTSAYSVSGISDSVGKAGGTMEIMGDAGYRTYRIPGHLLRRHPLYAAIVDADVLISAPIAKQHGSAGLTLAGKNLMGATNDRGRMHSMGLSQCIAELAAALRPDLAVIDATRILVRNGPTGGSLDDVVVKDTVIACRDWVAADSRATELFGETPAIAPYIKAGADMGLGTMDLSKVIVKNV